MYRREVAAGWLLRGLTAEYLLRRLYAVRPRDKLLLHAAAGGMGIIMSQWATSLGAVVIGHCRLGSKAAIARVNGCAEVIATDLEDFVCQSSGIDWLETAWTQCMTVLARRRSSDRWSASGHVAW